MSGDVPDDCGITPTTNDPSVHVLWARDGSKVQFGLVRDRPVWELQPSDPAMAQCGECFALVLRAAMQAHEHWHDQLKGRA